MRAKNGVYELFGGEDTRSFLYADDAAGATIALAESDAALSQIVNVGSTREMKIIDLAKMMMDVAGLDGEIVVHPSPAGSVPRRVPDVSKAKSLIGDFEIVSLEDGLKRTADFYLA
jgi:nucleoside-diphosphate-sugar epimerase